MVALAWQIGRRELQLSRPLVMGVLNLSPDSFYAGSRLGGDFAQIAEAVERMVVEGADIIDFGGESSRPGAEPVSTADEISRVLPALALTRERLPDAIISIDTYKSEVARAALDSGADIVNDISAARMDPHMLSVLRRSQCGYVLMHMQGTPLDMQQNPHYANVVKEVCKFLDLRLKEMETSGIARGRVVLDPGIGFGKRTEDNLALIAHASAFHQMGRPLLYGVSRKSFLGTILTREVEDRLEGTTAVHMFLLQKGVSILRVHDVSAARDAVLLYVALQEHIGSEQEATDDAG